MPITAAKYYFLDNLNYLYRMLMPINDIIIKIFRVMKGVKI